MKRYEGFLRGQPVRQSRPATWWLVAVQLQEPQLSATAAHRVSALRSWSVVEVVSGALGYSVRATFCGSSADGFWRAVAERTRSGRPIRLMSPRALMAWQVLCLWQQVENGSLRPMTGAVVRQREDCTREVIEGAGCLITSDPPTIGVFIAADSGARLTWVCAGNYGLVLPSYGRGAEADAFRLAEALIECDDVIRAHRLGGWALTASSMAMNGWLGSYDGPGIYLSGGGQGDKLENAARFGGLLLARPTGAEPILAYAVDARSQYPWIAAHYPQAVNMRRRGLTGAEARAAVTASAQSCLARCVVQSARGRYPARTAAGVVYPLGEFETCLCGPDLEDAARAGELKEVLEANEYELGTPLHDYQCRTWAARTECRDRGLEYAALLVKRLGVGLIGKLAQRSERWAECVPDINDPLWGGWHHVGLDGVVQQYRARAGVVEALCGRTLARSSVPSIPLWVWSWGRRRLRWWIECAGLDNVWYADTDGLVVSALGLERLRLRDLVRQGDWGMLRVVCGPSPCRISGVRDLEIGGRVVKAGLASNGRSGSDRLQGPAWYRLPWTEGGDPGWRGSWIEVMR